MVTSRAVVGSSARISAGWHIRAMAIMTRWRKPPESWCGYCFSRLPAAVMPTRSSSSMARARASRRETAPVPHERLLQLVADAVGRDSARSSAPEKSSPCGCRGCPTWRARRRPMRLCPSSSRRAAVRSACAGNRSMMASAVSDLPQPDSPTMHRVSPRSTWKETPCTACSVPAGTGRADAQVLHRQHAFPHGRLNCGSPAR